MNHAEQCLRLERCLRLQPLRHAASAIAPSTAITFQEPAFQEPAFQEPGFWQRVGQRLMTMLVSAPSLQVNQRVDRLGNRYWHAYDPTTGRSTTTGSATELRAWIEEQQY